MDLEELIYVLICTPNQHQIPSQRLTSVLRVEYSLDRIQIGLIFEAITYVNEHGIEADKASTLITSLIVEGQTHLFDCDLFKSVLSLDKD